jgi:hypothetical protein
MNRDQGSGGRDQKNRRLLNWSITNMPKAQRWERQGKKLIPDL